MTATEEMVLALLNDDIIEKAKQLYKTGGDQIAMKIYDITFLLTRTTSNIVIVEFPLIYDDDNDDDELIETPFGAGIKKRGYTFLNPIGFYTFTKEFLSTKIELTILRFCEDGYKSLLKQNKISTKLKINYPTLLHNAIIGAFSAEAAINIAKNKDCSFESNGLLFQIFKHEDGDSQIFLDKKYPLGRDLCIGIYYKDKNMFHANGVHDKAYLEYFQLNIFSLRKIY